MINAQSETLANLVHEKSKDTFTRTAYDPDSLMDVYGRSIEGIVNAAKRVIE